MSVAKSIQPVSFLIVLLGSLLLALGSALAQTTQPPPPLSSAEKLDQLIDLLGDPEMQAWLRTKAAESSPIEEISVASRLSRMEALYRDHLASLGNAIPRIPAELSRAANIVATDVNAGRPGKGLAIVTFLIAVGYAAEWLLRRVLPDARTPVPTVDAYEIGRTSLPNRILVEAGSLLAFSIASVGLFVAFDWPPLLRMIVLTYLFAFILFRIGLASGRILLAPSGDADEVEPSASARLAPMSNGEAQFWYTRLKIGAGYFLFVWATLSLLPSLGFSVDVVRLFSYVFGLGLLALAIEIVWQRPARKSAPAGATPWLLTGYLVVLWLVWVMGMYGLLWLGIYALLLPGAVSGAGRVADSAVDSTSATLSGALLKVLVVRGVRALVIAAAVAWLAAVVRFSPAAVGQNEILERVVGGLLNGVIVLLVADLVWNLAKEYIARKVEIATPDGAPSAEIAAHRSRLRTLLPIFRSTLAVFIIVVTVLTILSGIGVQIAPLIAGAGIFGVAIGFGSQTLVKDVLSGVFYMMDDAFRVGEYIQSGSYKGTVESFSLRSVKLRHHRGPLFTVPFGDLGAVQNMSRDWVLDKMVINVTYDSDLELARKLIKKIGLELAQDPEFAASTLQPLKMQGVDSFGDFAVVLRMKLMTKPGEQFAIKRKALLMIKKAFEDNGIKIAFPTVQVSGGGDEAAAAASETIRMRKAAEAAATAA
jgi:small-conductance mechanosensitive channel